MNHLYILLFLLGLNSCSSQVSREITTEIGYIPEQKIEIPDEEYRKWTTVLKNTYEQIGQDSENLVYADHLNIATAFMNLNEPKQKVLDQWFLAQEKNLESTAEVFPLIYRSAEDLQGYLSEAEYDSLIEKFEKVMADKEEKKVDPIRYANEMNLNVELVELMAQLKDKDQEFRMSDIDKQQLIDQENIKVIDSLYAVYQEYIGKSLVGEEYQHAMWGVIQHADLAHQEKYLPIVHDGVKNGELPATPLKMLIDRVYKKKYGYQIFGSQSGGDLADDATIETVKKEYGF